MTNTAAKKKSIYGVHPGVVLTMKWVAELKAKTGRSLAEWIKFIRKEGPPTEQARRDWLKQEHGLGTNSAGWLAEQSVGKGKETSDPDAYLQAAEKYVEEMFSGKKEHLRPIYDALLKLGLSMVRTRKPARVRRSCRSIAITCSLRSSRRPGRESTLVWLWAIPRRHLNV